MQQILVWSPKSFCSLFDVEWDKTQLASLLTDLNLPDGCSVAGGSLVRTLLNDDIFKGDIDIFAHSELALERAKEQYSKEKSWIIGKHAYNFEFNKGLKKTKVQLIIRDEPCSVAETLHKFDFEHCKIGVLFNTTKKFTASLKGPGPHFVTTMAAPICLAKKRITLGLVRDPNYSLGRAIKYKRMGFEADKAIETLAAMSIKKLTDVQCCDDATSLPIPLFDLEGTIATCSS